jgi:peptidyl-prolyl cis-trans isomerase-like 4
MENVLIDERRIHVDFSQSVAKLWNKHRRNVLKEAAQKIVEKDMKEREKVEKVINPFGIGQVKESSIKREDGVRERSRSRERSRRDYSDYNRREHRHRDDSRDRHRRHDYHKSSRDYKERSRRDDSRDKKKRKRSYSSSSSS